MDPDAAAVQLAQRLRALRTQGLQRPLTQRQLAEALQVSEPSISAWENTRRLSAPPPIGRLRDYAVLFARETWPESGQVTLPDPASFTDEERARRQELERNLLGLRAVALDEPLEHASLEGSRSVSFDDFEEELLGAQTVIQQVLNTFGTFLATGTDESRSASERLTKLLRSAPVLVGSHVLSDNELYLVETQDAWKRVWSLSTDDSIEFEYPVTGPSFAPVVVHNLDRGVQYRYLVPYTERAVERAQVITNEYQGIEIRFFDNDYLREFASTLDELIVYEPSDPGRRPGVYYLYPGSDPRRWIRADRHSAANRLHDVQQLWKYSKKGP
ncbi:helix-turn-helix transcriptional regulator [Actinoplanes sp. M2I2]|uniref:helix-turn-helix transcriptional regulator n=1 Tax=Actinoplanes sp. M2I2 TaxID=1734444 RepID=UPI002022363D|nr:helix-turn-helix transcriptional regulator [Actinoplanes sp. M2I2]